MQLPTNLLVELTPSSRAESWITGFPLNSLKQHRQTSDFRQDLTVHCIGFAITLFHNWFHVASKHYFTNPLIHHDKVLVKSAELVTWFLISPDVKQHVVSIPQCWQIAATWNVVKCIPFHLDSERIMGSPSLQPDMKDESADLQLEDDFLTQLKDKYCCRVKVSCRWGRSLSEQL